MRKIRNYLKIAQIKSLENGVTMNFSLGYMEEAKGKFDFVFNRNCWYYCMSDRVFAEIVYNLVKKNGYAYLIIPNEQFLKNRVKKVSFFVKIILLSAFYVNDLFNVKLGHAQPSQKKLERIFRTFDFDFLSIDVVRNSTIVKFRK